MSYEITPFDKERDRDACHRIWHEVGWLNPTDEKAAGGVDQLMEAGTALVARRDGEAECMVLGATGSIRYLEEDLPFAGVTGVTTSRVARKQGLAARMTAQMVAEQAEAGAIVNGLGMFEQGFYNRLGYGTGTYNVRASFDPQSLSVPFPERPPRRLTTEDVDAMHACLLARQRPHGGSSFDSANITAQQCTENSSAFGLGFHDGPNGELTHHVWLHGSGENGPYHVARTAYQTSAQLLELLGVIRTLGDQVRLVTMSEPPGVQIQDLVTQPIHNNIRTDQSKFQTGIRCLAWWQIRICDLERCLAQTHLEVDSFRFNLVLDDPIESFLKDRDGWRGISGEYLVTLGPDCAVESGADSSLPTLTTTVNAFSRMWLGVRPATGLAITDAISAPEDLLAKLDQAFRLPPPVRDWDF